MSDFKEYVKTNKEKLYTFAEKNTPKNADNRPMIEKDDPWKDETEWDLL